MRAPYVVSYGMGVDSTALLVGLRARGIRPDLILFADTRGEKAETYAYLDIINPWLLSAGMPGVTVLEYEVQKFKNWPPYRGLEENCLTNGTLPSEAFGFGSCSVKWKQRPQDTYLKAWQPALDAWARGAKVVKAIGYDASPADQKRACAKPTFRVQDDKRYSYVYPLQAWDWDRIRCVQEIAAAGLPVPPKSSCFYCPNMRPAEVAELPPEKLARIVIMEARAKPRLTKIEGLWRNGCKGTRGSEKKPATMTAFIREQHLLEPELIDRLIAEVPEELIARNAAHERGEDIETWEEFFARVLAWVG